MKYQMHISKLGLTICCTFLFTALSIVAAPLKIVLPPDTGTFKPAAGSELAAVQCLVCHSVEYVQMQPPKPLDFWTAEVKKMRDKYGAQFPVEDTPNLADYLAKNYGTATNNPASAAPATNSLTAATGAQPLDAQALATKFACLACHKPDVKLIGPAFKDVAAKYRNDADPLGKILTQIRTGGSGKWGQAPMPPFPNTIVSDEQAKVLGRWIMSQGSTKQ
jgi:cytochrome c551/c552